MIASHLWGLARALEEEGRYAEALPLAEDRCASTHERLRYRDVDESRSLVARLRAKVK